MDKQPVGQLPNINQSSNDDELMIITNDEYNQLKKEKISDFITDLTSTNENNALTKGTDGKMFVTDFGNASNITEGTLPVSVLPNIPKDKLPEIETDDLPDSGITAGTYTYPTDIIVNAKGQVTSITEGQPGANNANQDLSNLGPLGLDKLNQSKALETGNISSDADVYADVQKYAHSTFDLSKFEVVGSPNITDDGIASGFSGSNYLTFNPIQLANYNSWEIITPVFNLSSAISGNFNSVLMMVYNNFFGGVRIDIADSLKLRIFIGSSSTTDSDIMSLSNLTVSTNTNYQVKVQFTGTEYIVWYRTENGSWQEYDRVTSSTKIYNALNQFQIGQRNTAVTFFNGSIDLKSFSITADGVPVFNGNKTGTDTFGEIEIPYTLSNTGSKIVDAVYRGRVQDVYEQYGVAMYYTIDEENRNFTLPMGEIYGMISKNKEILDLIYPIGRPMQEINNELLENEVWLEGATVSRTDYANLFNVYGTTYGEGDGSTTFQLPDLRDRVLWGSPDASKGYIEPGLPNITGGVKVGGIGSQPIALQNATGAFTLTESGRYMTRSENGGNAPSRFELNASLSSSVYSDDVTTVQPPAFKVRWKTRFE